MRDDPHLGTGEYDPETYWDARARSSQGETYDAVCAFGRTRHENRAMERVQLATLRSFLDSAGVHTGSALELGCGVGRVGRVLLDRGLRYRGADISEAMLALARKNLPDAVECTKLESTALPMEDDRFDLTLSITVLHHNPHERQEEMVQELCRVTKPGGIVLLMEGVAAANTSFNMYPRTVEDWIGLVERRGGSLIRSRPQAWLYFRSHWAYAPLRLSRRLIGWPKVLRTRLDDPLAIASGLLDPYLLWAMPRRLATNAALMFRMQAGR